MNFQQEKAYEVEELDKSTYLYFSKVFSITNADMENKGDKEIFFKNVFNAMEGHEVQLICHRKLSYPVANLMTYANEENLLIILEKVRDNFCLIARHANGSHVLQSLLWLSLTHIDSPDEDHEKLIKRIAKLGMIVKENLDELLKHAQSCHVIATMLEVLSGCRVSDQIVKSKKSQDDVQQKGLKKVPSKEFGLRRSKPLGEVQVPERFLAVLRKLVKTLMKNEDFDGLLLVARTSIVVQTALLVLSKCDPETCQKLVELLMPKLFGSDTKMMKIMANSIYSPLVEKVIQTLSPEMFSIYWEKYMKGNLKEICIDVVANFVGQAILRSCPSKKELEEMFEELETSWTEIANAGHLGVLVAFSSACVKLCSCQAKFVQVICNLLHCSTPEAKELFVPLVIRWMSYEDFTNEQNKNTLWKFNYHGSLLVQNMLKFQKPFAVLESLFKMKPSNLASMLCNQSTSHILDAFSESPTVGKAKKNLLIEKLKGHFTTLAMDKFGSHCLEKLWESTDTKGKVPIVEDLAENAGKMKSSMVGSIIYSKFAVGVFQRNQKDWYHWLDKKKRKAEMFEDILEPDGQDKPKRKMKCN